MWSLSIWECVWKYDYNPYSKICLDLECFGMWTLCKLCQIAFGTELVNNLNCGECFFFNGDPLVVYNPNCGDCVKEPLLVYNLYDTCVAYNDAIHLFFESHHGHHDFHGESPVFDGLDHIILQVEVSCNGGIPNIP